MTSEHDQPVSREQRFQEILVNLVEASETGQTLDPEEWRARYPEFADELAEFFAGRRHLDQLAGTLRHAAGLAVQASEAPRTAASVAQQAQGPTRVRYFGDYELIEEIARGGMGVVYRARQVSLQRIVAVKMILAGEFASQTEVQRFRREAEAAANLDHPNIVPIYEVGEHEGQQYFSMKLVEGGSLAQRLPNRPPGGASKEDQRDAARLMALVARAVHYAHQRGIMHRDLKPANILLSGEERGTTDEGADSPSASPLSFLTPMITDFGLAKRIEGGSQPTRSGAVVGTPAYMAPEQARAMKGLSTAVDIYSLGAILYELLTGRPPFQATNPMDTILLLLDSPPIPVRKLNPAVDRDLETVCLKCLEKEPAKRYGSAEALAEDLERWLNGEPIHARPTSALERTIKWARRRPAIAALLVMTFTSLCALFASTWLFAIQQRNLKEEQLRTATQKAEADTQSRLAQLRLWQSLIGEAQVERLAGNRARSLELLARAARLEPAPELRQEAILTITSPGLRLLHQIPVGFINSMSFSPDGKILAVHGIFGSGPGWRADDPEPRVLQRLKVWRMPSGELLGDTHLPAQIGSVGVGHSFYRHYLFTEYNRFLPSPQSPLIALKEPQADKVRLWDPAEDRTVAELNGSPYSLVFSGDGRRLAAPGLVWDLPKPGAGKPGPGGIPIAFLSDDELVTGLRGKDFRLQRVAVATGKQLGISPAGAGVLMVSDDGRLAAIVQHAAKTGDPVGIWDMVAGKELASIPGAVPAGYSPFGAQFSPDGSYFAIDDPLRPNSFKLWDRASGLHEGINGAIAGGGSFNQFQRAAFSPNAALLVIYAQKDRQSLHLWDVRGERRVVTLLDNHTPVWSGDGRWLATIAPGKLRRADGEEYGDDRTFVNVWEVFYPAAAANLGVPVDALAFRPDGKELVANNRLVKIEASPVQPTLLPSPYRVQDPPALLQAGERLWTLDFPGSPTELRPTKLVRLRPPGKEVVLKMPSIKREPQDQKNSDLVAVPVRNAWSLDREGRRLVAICQISNVFSNRHGYSSSGDTRFLSAWDLETGEVQVMSAGRRALECLAIDPAQKILATGDNDGVTFWELATLEPRKRIKNLITTSRVVEGWSTRGGSGAGPFEYSFKVLCVRFSPDGGRLYAASSGGGVDVYDAVTGQHVGFWDSHHGRVLALALHPDGHLLASGGDDRTIRLSDTASGKELGRWHAHEEAVTALAFSSDGQTLASSGGDGRTVLWNLPFIQQELKTLGLGW
jgi:serine/threonine protein kinase/WD40 repeat protein